MEDREEQSERLAVFKSKVVAMIKDGLSVEDIATVLKVNRSTISRWCKESGVSIRRLRLDSPLRRVDRRTSLSIYAAKRAGATWREVADKWGLSLYAVKEAYKIIEVEKLKGPGF
jgi:DNA invertase Pin-like site-specific DNA recombinase